MGDTIVIASDGTTVCHACGNVVSLPPAATHTWDWKFYCSDVCRDSAEVEDALGDRGRLIIDVDGTPGKPVIIESISAITVDEIVDAINEQVGGPAASVFGGSMVVVNSCAGDVSISMELDEP